MTQHADTKTGNPVSRFFASPKKRLAVIVLASATVGSALTIVAQNAVKNVDVDVDIEVNAPDQG